MFPGSNKNVCFITAVAVTFEVFMVEHCKLINSMYNVFLITQTNDKDFLKPFGLNIPVIPVRIERKISPVNDLKALIKLYNIFCEYKFDAIHSVTPKAGLLSMLAGAFAHIPIRIHTFTGQVWATKKGLARWLLKTMDKLLAACATHILVDSYSQRDFLINQGIVNADKSSVIADGSICGVDTDKFSPNPKAREKIRRQLEIRESDAVFLYLGRLNRDKGLFDLAVSFRQICEKYKDVHLLIVGPDEQNMKEQIESICAPCLQKLHFVGYTDVPEAYFAAADVFCLPSYREGFGVVIIQAASAGVPSIGTRIYGVTETIEEGITGLFYHPGNVDELTSKMAEMIEKPDTRKIMGQNARIRTSEKFSKERVTKAFADYYKSLFFLNDKAAFFKKRRDNT